MNPLEIAYARASRVTGPRMAAETPDIVADGYWLDDEQYFFVAERRDPESGRIVGVPSLVHARRREVREVIAWPTLDAVMSELAGPAVDWVADAQFDMPDVRTLAVSARGQHYFIDVVSLSVTRQAGADEASLYSPDGRYACFVREHDLWVRDRHTGAEHSATRDGTQHFAYGRESEGCLWPLSYRQRPHPAALWSPDSQWLLTHQIDERAVPALALVQHAPPDGGRPVLHRYKYPMPGDTLPTATFVAVHVATGRVIRFEDWPVDVPAFSPFFMRVVWFGGPGCAWFVRMDRHCRHAELIRMDLDRGTARVVLSERVADGWLDLHPMLGSTPNVRVLEESAEIIWYSARGGSGHVYLYDAVTGALKNAITRGPWMVRDVLHVDEARRRVYFLAGGLDANVDPARRVLCVVNLDGSDFAILRRGGGDVWMSKSGRFGNGQDRPYRPAECFGGISPAARFGILHDRQLSSGERVQVINLSGRDDLSERDDLSRRNDLSERSDYSLATAPSPDFILATAAAPERPAARPFTALAADGATRLHGVMFLPPNFRDDASLPLIDYIYPGPQKAQQPQSADSLSAAQALSLAELGFITIMLDTRGMPIGDRAFHQAGYGALLEPQLADHAAVVRQLCDRHSFIDRERIGMLGWSGGGYATARALCDYGEIFKVGVAVCGNHEPNHYAAFWSEKYRGPGTAGKFVSQSSIAVASKLTGKLLLITGDLDDNVHPAHTLALADALVRANKDFDLLVVPNADHYVLITSGYAQRRVWDYFVKHLLRAEPPREFDLRFTPNERARFQQKFWREIRQ